MAIQDTPVSQQQVTMQDTPAKLRTEVLGSDASNDFLAVQAAFLENYVAGTDVVVFYNICASYIVL